jgi:hypothetical protein
MDSASLGWTLNYAKSFIPAKALSRAGNLSSDDISPAAQSGGFA